MSKFLTNTLPKPPQYIFAYFISEHSTPPLADAKNASFFYVLPNNSVIHRLFYTPGIGVYNSVYSH